MDEEKEDDELDVEYKGSGNGCVVVILAIIASVTIIEVLNIIYN